VRLGFVDQEFPTTLRDIDQFWERLRELGWVEGQNLIVERRWAEGHAERLAGLMNEMVADKVDVIVTYSTPAAIAAKNATSTIPIVAVAMGDPIRSGLAASLARPGGNLTGQSMGYGGGTEGKWLELLQEMVPRLSTVAVIENPDNPAVRDQARALKAFALTRGLKLRFIDVREPDIFPNAFKQARREAQAVLVLADPLTTANRARITALAAEQRLPAMYGLHPFMDAGGLISYAADMAVMFRRAADCVDKIVKGAKPAELPIEQPTQYLLVVNLKTATALGITIPESILLRADEVIR
jgi:putative ABC transport system substrate-binding protein